MRRLPFFTPLAAATIVVTAGAIAAAWWWSDGRIASPGPLATPHAELACRSCHPAPWSAPTIGARCLACHDEVRAEVDRGDGLHAHLGAPQHCLACHPDHRGAAAPLTRLDPDSFPHQVTGFALDGKHAGVACERCHQIARPDRGFARAPGRCVDCHRDDDTHAGRLGDDCGRCHGAAGWKPATFDHATTKFPLTGAHVRTACDGCHTGGRYEDTPTACVACHPMPDDHRGTFGDDCAGCHDTARWEGARFDHRFPLDHGARRASACATCHPTGYRTYTCYGCHEHTPANIERKHRKEGIADFRDCMRCHPTGREDEGEGGGDDGDDDD